MEALAIFRTVESVAHLRPKHRPTLRLYTGAIPRIYLDKAGAPVSRQGAFAAMTGTDVGTYMREREGMSAFALEDGIVYHTYSTHARGVDLFFGVYHWLDRASKGRNETGPWFRRHDEYDSE